MSKRPLTLEQATNLAVGTRLVRLTAPEASGAGYGYTKDKTYTVSVSRHGERFVSYDFGSGNGTQLLTLDSMYPRFALADES